MAGFSPSLPLVLDALDGPYRLNKTFKAVARQNLKMIILTAPGERMMDPFFGVGARNFLFESRAFVLSGLTSKITSQVRRYASYITIRDMTFFDLSGDPVTGIDVNDASLGLRIEYFIVTIGMVDVLQISGIGLTQNI